MNSEGYYAVTAEEGVLRINATYVFDIISGKTSDITLALPEKVVVYQVVGEGITDWRTFHRDKERRRFLNIYFDQPRHGKYKLHVTYDELIPKLNARQGQDISIPLLQPEPVHRYQGTVLLLSSETLEFVPKKVEGFIPVGAEVLPAEIKSKLKHKVAFGYKYVGKPSPLLVKLELPQQEQAKFDSTINMLYTIEEGILKARSSVDITVKSGVLKEVVFIFARGTTILDLVSPSLLKVSDDEMEDEKRITVQFTQAMEGSFRVDITFETLLDSKLTSIQLTPVKTLKAEVERGYIGIESVSTVEVVTEKFEEIQEIDSKELPLWLTERTNRPILLAYKYSHQPYELAVKITRHESVPSMEARITAANSKTSYQKDGNSLTETTYTIVNFTKQFLRIEMPENARLWKAEIGDEIVKTAKDKDGRLILPLPRSREPIICKIKYSEKKVDMKYLGKIKVQVPHTDLYMSHLNWELDLPSEFSYFMTSSNMDVEAMSATDFKLKKSLTAADDEILYFKSTYRLKKGRLLMNGVTLLLTLLLAWLYSRRSRDPSMTEKIVTLVVLALFIFMIIFLKLSLLLIGIALLIIATSSYLLSSKQNSKV